MWSLAGIGLGILIAFFLFYYLPRIMLRRQLDRLEKERGIEFLESVGHVKYGIEQNAEGSYKITLE